MGISLVFGVSPQRGLSAWVWGFSRPSSLGGVPQLKFIGVHGGWGFLGLLLVPLPRGFPCGGLCVGLVSAGLFLYLFVGMMASWVFCWWGSSIVLYGVFGSPWFHDGVYVGFVCCAGILISLLSSF